MTTIESSVDRPSLLYSAELQGRRGEARNNPLPAWPDSHAPEYSTDETEPCPRPERGCGPTHAKHRFWLPLDSFNSDPAGHDLLIVMFNPTCPDHGDGITLRNCRWFASEIRARSACLVSLFSRRTDNRVELRALASEAQHEANLRVLERAPAMASLVLIAWGQNEASTSKLLRQERTARSTLRASMEANPGAIAVAGPATRHPGVSTWRGEVAARLTYWFPW